MNKQLGPDQTAPRRTVWLGPALLTIPITVYETPKLDILQYFDLYLTFRPVFQSSS